MQERLEREYDLDLIVTAPSVVYEVELNDGTKQIVDTPGKLVRTIQPTSALSLLALGLRPSPLFKATPLNRLGRVSESG